MSEAPEVHEPNANVRWHRPEQPSLTWPILLIGGGIIFLMANLGMLPGSAGFLLARLWPVILIVIGIEMVLGRRARWLSALLALAVVAAVIALLLFGPPLPFLNPSGPTGGEEIWPLFQLTIGR